MAEENNMEMQMEESEAVRKSMSAAVDVITEVKEQTAASKASDGTVQQTDGNDDVSSYFTNLPIGQLICAPFIEMAKGQAALCEVYVNTLFQIAFKSDSNPTLDGENETRELTFKYTRPVADEVTGEVKSQNFEIKAPLLSLVPIPAFLMDSADVSFNMEVNIQNSSETTKEESINSSVNFKYWGFTGNIGGKVSNNSHSSRSNSQKAVYNISVHASQQPVAEGMSKLTALLAETMEPIVMSQ